MVAIATLSLDLWSICPKMPHSGKNFKKHRFSHFASEKIGFSWFSQWWNILRYMFLPKSNIPKCGHCEHFAVSEKSLRPSWAEMLQLEWAHVPQKGRGNFWHVPDILKSGSRTNSIPRVQEEHLCTVTDFYHDMPANVHNWQDWEYFDS